ncbi:MAG: hypothetical protein NZ580_06065 [Bacteroidia bacterium]|nr:hypothetical protein [Bacteroidia bacterium]MDW8235390.1 hypothetical protein [Bacteroidia bacterium]
MDPKTKKQLSLYYPMTLEGLISAVAYCVGREAAQGIVRANTPLSCNADMWATFFSRGAFRRLRILYPITVRIVGFRSTLSPYSEGPLQRLISYLAYKRRLPFLYQYRLWKERVIMERLWKENITFVDSPPIFNP